MTLAGPASGANPTLEATPVRRSSVGVTTVAVAAVVTGTIARLAYRGPLWLDEAQSAALADHALLDLPAALRNDGAPPLYYAALHAWERLVGDSPTALRSFSVLCSLLTLAVIPSLCRRLGRPDAAIPAVAVMAVNPFAVRYATELRMYALVMLEAALLLWALAGAVRNPSRRRTVLVAVASAALVWTHYWALYLVLATAGVLAWRTRRTGAPRPKAALVGLAGGAGTLVLWLPWFVDQARHTATPWAAPAGLDDLERTALAFAGETARPTGGTLFLVVLMVIAAALGAFASRRPPDWIELDLRGRSPGRELVIVVCLTVLIALLAAIVSGTAFEPRYASVVLVPIVLAVALGFAALPRFSLAALGVVVLASVAVLPRQGDVRTQANEIAAVLRASVVPGDTVVVCPDQLDPALRRLLPGLELHAFPRDTSNGLVVWRDYADAVDAADAEAFAGETLGAAPAGTVWLVWSDRYRLVGDECGRLARTLDRQRPGATAVVGINGRYFENAYLTAYPPPAPLPDG